MVLGKDSASFFCMGISRFFKALFVEKTGIGLGRLVKSQLCIYESLLLGFLFYSMPVPHHFD